jgi:hypothetical protein
MGLSAKPPAKWMEGFRQPTGSFPIPVGMHQPTLGGMSIGVSAPDAEIEAYARHIDARVAHTNDWYEHEVIPQMHAADEARDAERRAEAERLSDAQRRLDAFDRDAGTGGN